MIILGSGSDYKIAEKAVKVLEEMEVPYDIRVASAHRTHARVKNIMTNCDENIEVFIGIAGLAAHLPGVMAAYTTKPVIAVPCEGKLGGLDALLSSTEMQLGTPVATVGIDRGENAAWLACQIIACNNEIIKQSLINKRESYNQKMDNDEKEVIEKIAGKYYSRTTPIKQEVKTIDKKLEISKDTRVLLISGNYSNIETVHKITQTLDTLNIKSQYKVISATRTPDKLEKYIADVDDFVDLYIVVSSLSTVLSGAVVSHTTKPVIGVPCSTSLLGIDSLLTMVEMPPGVPTATMGIDAGENAAIYVARILSIYDEKIRESLKEYMKTLHRNIYYE
ncbi:5-(carboxyamino)imidazole ribonucleotide mutase [Methanosphaera sp. WGK6]|uniref:5-(carboxyamino)imidazole ribonucleotide mutase n=1 Tax=Methanosphaera sp. WGK6 TaxID=1561964 RepID=UPI00084C1CE8|nr:5-(carboxyamino)imidazole ribonucleotide mutase [Methanosphaera sp. WGK6]OED29688.1 hypothetical protein NL43_06780 [Methanosphaera sp. WGK6]